MLTLTTPFALVGAKNSVSLGASSDKYITASGSKASLRLHFADIPVDGDTFSIQFGDFDEIFTCKTAPDDSGFEFYDNTARITPLTLEEYVAAIAGEIFEMNRYLSDDYLITADWEGTYATVGDLVFTAREVGTASDIDSDLQAVAWPHTTPKTAVAGVDNTYSANFKIEAAVEFEDVLNSGDYNRRITLELPPADDSSVKFELSEFLYTALKNESNNFNLPAYNQSSVAAADKICRRYRVRVTEKYGSTPEYYKGEGWGGITGSAFALYGGFNPVEVPGSAFLTYMNANKKFLSFYPGTKDIGPDQHEYLYYPTYADNDLKLYGDVYFTDGTSSLNNLLKTKLAAKKYEVYCFPAGYSQLAIAAINVSKTVAYYDLKVKDASGNLISELRRYRMIYKENYRSRYFLFLNSLGAYETLWCRGVQEFNPKYTGEIFEHILEPGYAVPDGQFQELGRSTEMIYKGATGFVTKAEIDYLAKEFMNSERVYLVSRPTGSDPDGWYVPVLHLSDEQAPYDDEKRLFAFDFQYKIAYIYGVHSGIWDVI